MMLLFMPLCKNVDILSIPCSQRFSPCDLWRLQLLKGTEVSKLKRIKRIMTEYNNPIIPTISKIIHNHL
jgi:hypothetical protein